MSMIPGSFQGELARLMREREEPASRGEAVLHVAGSGPGAWVVKVLSCEHYNLYNVQQVRLNAAGVSPSAVSGSETQAVNIGESFLSAGSVSAGTYAVMWRVGDANVMLTG